MFDETDPELEEKATGLPLLAAWGGCLVVGWCLVCAAVSFIAYAVAPAAGALWRAFQ